MPTPVVYRDVPVLDDVAYQAEEAGSQYATSDSGTLVYLTADAMNPLMALTAVDRGGGAELLFEPDHFIGPKVSPNGGRVAVGIKNAGGGQDLWILDLDRGSRTRITDERGGEPNAVWTWQSDDLIVSYEAAEGAPYFRAGRAAADGSGRIEPLLGSNDADIIPSSLTPDGRVLAYVLGTHTSTDIWTMPLDGGGEPTPFLETAADEGMPAFSPNGRWIAYQSNDSGRFEIYVQPYPGPGRRITVSTGGGVEATWSPDGGDLFYRPLDENGLMVAQGDHHGHRTRLCSARAALRGALRPASVECAPAPQLRHNAGRHAIHHAPPGRHPCAAHECGPQLAPRAARACAHPIAMALATRHLPRPLPDRRPPWRRGAWARHIRRPTSPRVG